MVPWRPRSFRDAISPVSDGHTSRPPRGMGSAATPGLEDVTLTSTVTTNEADVPAPGAGGLDFTAVVSAELDLMLRVARDLTGSTADAEDVVQETLIRAHHGWERFDGRYPRAWLLTILRRTFLNSVRRTRPALLEDDWNLDHARPAFGSSHQQTASAEEIALDHAYDPATMTALRRLSPDHRAVLWLVDVEDLSTREAALVLGIPEGTATSRLSRARSRLRAFLSTRGAE